MKEKPKSWYIKRAKKWLEWDTERQKNVCPFGRTNKGQVIVDHHFCATHFARITKRRGFINRCPCSVYNPTYVRRKVQRIVAEYEEKRAK